MTVEAVSTEQITGGFYNADTNDFTSAVVEILKSDGSIEVIHRSWITERALYDRIDITLDEAKEFYNDNDFIIVKSKYVDYTLISDWFVEQTEKSPIEAIGFDPYKGMMLAEHLASLGFKTVLIRQVALTLDQPTRDLMWLESAGKLINDKMLSWYFSNVEIKSDKKGNHFPGRKSRTHSTSGVNALINAHALALDYTRFIKARGDQIYES
ncbi:terminase large subunit [Bacillus atrophaeus]|uniref:terminase TerL endonuclease subunit n=1 Tax=Bacillus atrophaeus TaxID=1452 RepID=UPI00227F2869|nr:terminase TerL endonuclease subunit [Bacillus atrophaeus]MCY9198112.1 terminase large subunit [Bacillus atrophaeus]